uniref:Uncharacterized protein n=1 Tax=Globodera rostochiensis TaxID=31243 RepID=A0A914HUL0_GLORO
MAAMAATPIGDEVAHFHFDIFMATRDEPTNTQVFAAQDTTEAMCAVLVSYCTSMNVFAASFRGKKIIWSVRECPFDIVKFVVRLPGHRSYA